MRHGRGAARAVGGRAGWATQGGVSGIDLYHFSSGMTHTEPYFLSSRHQRLVRNVTVLLILAGFFVAYLIQAN